MRDKPLVLAILDGWGYRSESHGNAIALARKPTYDHLLKTYPNTLIHTSGPSVGLPPGQMGNSEVGHLNMGAGRIVHMDVTRLDAAIADGSFFSNPELLAAMRHARQEQRGLHLFGLLSDGGVHSQQRHLYALLRLAKEQGVERTFVHCFMDGRDTLPTNGASYIEQLQQQIREIGVGAIASVSGRFYAMDRDLRWERQQKAFEAMVEGNAEGGRLPDAAEGMKAFYNRGITDEFAVPFVCVDKTGNTVATVGPEDSCICFNFRADRARQITRSLARNSGLTPQQGMDLPGAVELEAVIPSSRAPEKLHYVCMTRYDTKFTLPWVLPPESLDNILANVMGEAGWRNLRIAESEKYAHVTYFFNGGLEKSFAGEDRVLIPSVKVKTYDLQPQMSAAGIAAAVVRALKDATFDVLVVNFANADMVGHSGRLEPTITAVESVDAALGTVYAALRRAGGSMLITADHGNAELMFDPLTGGPHTSHTTNPVPLIAVTENFKQFTLRPGGSLRDLSPTILAMRGLAPPRQMTGGDLRIPLNEKEQAPCC